MGVLKCIDLLVTIRLDSVLSCADDPDTSDPIQGGDTSIDALLILNHLSCTDLNAYILNLGRWYLRLSNHGRGTRPRLKERLQPTPLADIVS